MNLQSFGFDCKLISCLVLLLKRVESMELGPCQISHAPPGQAWPFNCTWQTSVHYVPASFHHKTTKFLYFCRNSILFNFTFSFTSTVIKPITEQSMCSNCTTRYHSFREMLKVTNCDTYIPDSIVSYVGCPLGSLCPFFSPLEGKSSFVVFSFW